MNNEKGLNLNAGCISSKLVVCSQGAATLSLASTQNAQSGTDKMLTFELALAGAELAGVKPVFNRKNSVVVSTTEGVVAKLEATIVPVKNSDNEIVGYKLRSTPLQVANEQKIYTLVWSFVGNNPLRKMYKTTEVYTFSPVSTPTS